MEVTHCLNTPIEAYQSWFPGRVGKTRKRVRGTVGATHSSVYVKTSAFWSHLLSRAQAQFTLASGWIEASEATQGGIPKPVVCWGRQAEVLSECRALWGARGQLCGPLALACSSEKLDRCELSLGVCRRK